MTSPTADVLAASLQPSPVPLLRRSDDRSMRRDIESRTLHRVRAGVFAPAEQWAALPPWQKYLARIHALALKRPAVVFTHESAAALWGLPVLGDLRTIHVLVARKGDARRVGNVQGHHAVEEPDLADSLGVCATTAVATAVDLARSRHPAYGLAVADALLRTGACSRERLLLANDARRSGRGRAVAAWPLEHATPLSESVLESISRAAIEWLGLPIPRLQSRFVIDGAEYRADFEWPDQQVIGEADGDTKYAIGDAADAVIREKKREDALRRSMRGFARWGWNELRAPERLGLALEAAGVPVVRPPRTTHLHGLAQLLNR
jgi:hypothetical protein